MYFITISVSQYCHRVQIKFYITRNGKTIAKVVNPQISAVDSIRGLLAGAVHSLKARHNGTNTNE